MHSFFNNQSLHIKNNEMNNFETVQKARQDLVGEIQAIIDYDEHIHHTSDSVAKETWAKIKNEELHHVGELIALLGYLDSTQISNVQEGINEFNKSLNGYQSM